MLIVHLFISYAHVNLCHFFSSSWCQGLAATSACGYSWTFLFTFLFIYLFIFYYYYLFLFSTQRCIAGCLYDAVPLKEKEN